jgi:hypothetical protein
LTAKSKGNGILVSPLRVGGAVFQIEGTAPLMTAKFSSRTKRKIIEEREAGSSPARRGKKGHEPADYETRGYEAAYVSTDGWYGVHAAAFRQAAISACRLVGFRMTLAKLSIFVEADGYDRDEGTPLIRIQADKPTIVVLPVRNDTGVMDLRARPMWAPGWRASVRVQWDADQFGVPDITNLMRRVGRQVGIGEGRPDSRNSAGLGYGLFAITGVMLEQEQLL